MINFFKRLHQRWHLWNLSDDYLARRVMVENYLINVSQGNKPPVEGEVAKQLALHLGVPTDVSKLRSLKERLEKING
jgi:7-cyano-7-deazaguanine synthase in queuosine biosynthesis